MSDPTHTEVYAAIEVIKAHLDKDWISEGCSIQSHVLGCASCQAVQLKRQLAGLAEFLKEDDAALQEGKEGE